MNVKDFVDVFGGGALTSNGIATFAVEVREPGRRADLATGAVDTPERFRAVHGGSLLVTDDAAIAELHGPDGLRFTGTSKRHPDDAPDARVGAMLAVSRALRDAADYYQSFADQVRYRAGAPSA